MKTTFKSVSEVAHLWANKLQTDARYSGGNFYFDGDTIYSYGRHFPIARHVTNAQGKAAVLFTERTYSPTTSNHIQIVKQACSHIDIIYCLNPEGINDQTNFGHWVGEAEAIAAKLAKARKPEKYLNELSAIQTRAHKYADFFGIPIPETLVAVLSIGSGSEYATYHEKKTQYAEAEKKRAEELLKKQHAESLKKWEKGLLPRLYTRNDRDYLRLETFSQGKKTIETSQGVKVPFDYAKKIWDKLESGKLKAGDKVLDFEVSEVGKMVRIGCHTFPMAYLKAFGNKVFK